MPGLNKLKRAFGNIWAMAAVAIRKNPAEKISAEKVLPKINLPKNLSLKSQVMCDQYHLNKKKTCPG